MTNLSTLAVYKQKCLLPTCKKKTEATFDGLFVCCIEHWFAFRELSKEIDSLYGWDVVE
jgi:hypothetical protein